MIFLPVEHGQDDQRGQDKHLHVCPQVPSLSKATCFLGQIGYVQDDVPPLFRTASANPLAIGCKPRLCDKVLGDGDVEANNKS